MEISQDIVVHIDYLRVTVFDPDTAYLDAYLDTWFGRSSYRDWGRWMYRESVVYNHGAVLYYNHRSSNRPVATVDIPSHALSWLAEQTDDIFGWVDGLVDGSDYRITRIDVAVDYLPYSVDGYISLVSDFRKKRKLKEKYIVEDSKTYYLGSRSSLRMARVYDEHGYTRVEVEHKGRVADRLYWYLQRVDSVSQGMINAVMSFVPLFIDNVAFDKIKLTYQQYVSPTLQRAVAYLARISRIVAFVGKHVGFADIYTLGLRKLDKDPIPI